MEGNIAMPGRPPKEFQQYLVTLTDAHVSHKRYRGSPATALLEYTVEAKDTINHCIKKFHHWQTENMEKKLVTLDES